MKKYTEERQIWMDFKAMVEAETEDAARAIAEAMPIKVLRKVWEYKAPAYLTSDTKGLWLWRMLKAEWVDEVVRLAREMHGKAQAEVQAAETLEEAYSDNAGDNAHPDEDIPAGRDTDALVEYADVKAVYDKYERLQDNYERWKDKDEKDEFQTARKRYLEVLKRYRKSSPAEIASALSDVRNRVVGKTWPLGNLESLGKGELVDLAHRCGIHADWVETSVHDTAVRILRAAGVSNPGLTWIEEARRYRKDAQSDAHAVWKKRQVLRRAMRMLSSDLEYDEDKEALEALLEDVSGQISEVMEDYRTASRRHRGAVRNERRYIESL